MDYRLDIQILRGIAVLMVVLFHLEIFFFESGFLGVDIFFVISGYLMAQLYNKGTTLDFYKKRFKRILPAYFVTIGLVTFVVGVSTIPSDANQRIDRLIYDILAISNMAFWLENTYFAKAEFRPLLNLWSLAIELQYYLIVPLLLPIVRRSKFLLLAFILISLAATFFVTTVSPKTSFFMLPFRVWEFLIGAYVAWHIKSRFLKKRNFSKSLILIMLLCSVLLIPFEKESLNIIDGHPGLASLFVSLISGLILLRPLHSNFSDNNIIGKSFVTLGKYSYSIYLVHFPVIVILNYTAFGGTILGFENFQIFFLFIIFTAIFSFFMFHVVEVIRIKKDFSKKMFLIALASILLSVSGVAINEIKYNNKKQNLIFDAVVDKDTWRCGKIFRILNPNKHLCPISDIISNTSVILIGDSHADSIKKQFSNRMSLNDISSYFYVSNNPLKGSKINADIVINDIKKLNINSIILHYSPSFYENVKYRAEITKLLSMLKEEDVEYYFLSPVPNFKYNVLKRMHEQSLDPNKNYNETKVKDYLLRNSFFFEYVNLKKIPLNRLYLTHKYLCPKDECIIQKDDKPLYFDSEHLTLTGANLLTPIFDNLALQIANK